jgi:dTDP-4-amino-4,6-dideoxygalactose transaminase
LSLKDEFDQAILKVVSETAFISGRYAKAFEESFAEYLGARHCIAVANGTDALEIALQAIGIGAGDDVLVPANTFFATAEAVSNIGAKPVFVDIDQKIYNLDPSKIEEKITPRTKAIIPVHL